MSGYYQAIAAMQRLDYERRQRELIRNQQNDFFVGAGLGSLLDSRPGQVIPVNDDGRIMGGLDRFYTGNPKENSFIAELRAETREWLKDALD